MTKHPRAHHEYGDVCLLLDCRFDVFDMFQGDGRVDLCGGVVYALTFFSASERLPFFIVTV